MKWECNIPTEHKRHSAVAKQPNIQKAFEANFGGTSTMRNKLYYVIAKFVPTTFDTGSSYVHTKIEEDSMLGTGTIIYLKYIKPPQLHMDNQKVVYVSFGFSDHNNVNKAIEADNVH